VGESSFWYRPTRVVPDQRPLNGRCSGYRPQMLSDSHIFQYKAASISNTSHLIDGRMYISKSRDISVFGGVL